MAKSLVLTDKTYKLISGAPLSYTLLSRNSPRAPLMWFDEEKGINRVLRYATNQNSKISICACCAYRLKSDGEM